MSLRIAKEFRWEMGHRLPFHTGGCQNIHGHSYRLVVEVEGETDANGMLLDYGALSRIVSPLVDELDHAFACNKADDLMRPFLEKAGMKVVWFETETTAENLAQWFLGQIAPMIASFANVASVSVRLHETAKVYAEATARTR